MKNTNWFASLFRDELTRLIIGIVSFIAAIISFLIGSYYSPSFQNFTHGNYGHPHEWLSSILLYVLPPILGCVAWFIFATTKTTPSDKPPFQHVFSCAAFIPAPPQYLSLKISLEIPKAEKDSTKLAQVENAVTAAVTRAVSTLPPNTERHEIHPKIESAIRQAASRTSHFSFLNPHILSLEFSSKNPAAHAAAAPSDDIDIGYHL